MLPFTAFFLIFTGAVIQGESASNQTPEVAPMPKRGGYFSQDKVFAFDTTGDCNLPEGIDPILCVADPVLTAIPTDEAAWLTLAAKASRAFLYSFGDTELEQSNKPNNKASNAKAPVALNDLQLTEQVLRNGLSPKGVSGLTTTADAQKGYQLTSYDMRVCSLGGRINVRLLDREPIGTFGQNDAFSIRHTACDEPSFSTASDVLSNQFSEIKSTSANGFGILSQGRLARIIGSKQYIGTALALEQEVTLDASSATYIFSNGAVGYCEAAKKGKVDWDAQCKRNGVVLDGLRVTKIQEAAESDFPGTSYMAVSMANPASQGQSNPDKFELVGKDVKMKAGSHYPYAGVLTLVGGQGEKVRLEFQADQVNISRLTPGADPKVSTLATSVLLAR